MTPSTRAAIKSAWTWLPGYCAARLRQRSAGPIRRIWVVFADHFEPGWRQADERTALERVRRWTERWPAIAARHADSAGHPPCYTFFYPVEQYAAAAIDELSRLRGPLGDVEVHLHHDGESEQQFVDRLGGFIHQLRDRHGLLRTDQGRIAFGFIHGNWALDNSLAGGRYCGLNNEITLLRRLGCYADFTLPAAPSPAQTRTVNTIYWATDDPATPKSHDVGTPVTPGGATTGDLLMIPGPLAINLREWRTPLVPRLEVGELGGHCLPTRHRVRLWMRASPRLGEDLFVKLFAHGAPEKHAVPMLASDGVLDRTLRYLTEEAGRREAQLFFVSAWQMRLAIDAIRRGVSPTAAVFDSPLDKGLAPSRAIS